MNGWKSTGGCILGHTPISLRSCTLTTDCVLVSSPALAVDGRLTTRGSICGLVSDIVEDIVAGGVRALSGWLALHELTIPLYLGAPPTPTMAIHAQRRTPYLLIIQYTFIHRRQGTVRA
jgi:hypothetical protein